MTAGTLTWSLISAGVFVGSGAVVAVTVKRAFFAGWRGSASVVVVTTVWLSWALALGQLLGAFGWLRRWPLSVTAATTGGVAWLVARRNCPVVPASDPHVPASGPAGPATPATPVAWPLLTATVLLVLLVAAIWTARTVIAVHRGIVDPDSLGYHLPFATTFAQSGFADQHRFVVPTWPVHFYPANDELLVAIWLVLTHSIAFAAVKNLVFGGLALVAAHAIGKAYGAGVAAVGGAAIVLGLPVIAFTQSGEAVNDALLLLLLLSGVALLAHARDRPAPYVLALACAGMAFGVKFSAVIPAVSLGGLAVALLLARAPTHRWRWAATGTVAGLATGAYWYARNAISYGNPIPPVGVAIGPFHLHQIATAVAQFSQSVAFYLVRGRNIKVFGHGLVRGLGPLVVAVAALGLFGAIAGLRSGDGVRRGLGALAVIACLGYLVMPASAFGTEGRAEWFVINIHYAAPALMAAVVSAALALGRGRWAWVFPGAGWVIVLTGIRSGRDIAPWASEVGGKGFALLVAASLGGALTALIWARGERRPWVTAGALGTALIGVIGLAAVAHHGYPGGQANNPVQRWAASARGVTIAGFVPFPAELYGPGSPNRLVVLTRLVDDAPVPIDSCHAWMQALIRGHYRYTAVIPRSIRATWVTADPAFRLEAANDHEAVYQIVGTPDPMCSR